MTGPAMHALDATVPPLPWDINEFAAMYRVQPSAFRVQGAGFRVQGSGFRVPGAGFSVVRDLSVRRRVGW